MNMMKGTIERDTLIEMIKENDWQINEWLVDQYPWLCPCRDEDGDFINDYDYTWTELYNVPCGWLDIVLDLCEDIKQVLLMYNIPLKHYILLDVKEKWGGLCWNDELMGFDEMPDEIDELISKATSDTYNHCIICGKPKQTSGYYCSECAKRV